MIPFKSLPQSKKRFTAARILSAGLAFFLSFYVLPVSQAQESSAPKQNSVIVQNSLLPTTLPDWIEDVKEEKASFQIVSGRSHYIKFKRRINRISISNPEILDFTILSPEEILLNAKQEGSVNLMAWDEKSQVSVFDIQVTKDPNLLMEVFKQIDPEGSYEIYPSKDVFVVKGEATSVEKAGQIEKAANGFAEGSVAIIHVRDAKQILLQVRYIQVDRSQSLDLGVDFEHIQNNKTNNVGQRFLPGQTNATTDGEATITFPTPDLEKDTFNVNDTDIYQIFMHNDREFFNAYFKALETRGVAKTIARPNLLTRDGEEASFLVGGEAALLTSTDSAVKVEYKEFGTRLTFKPEVLSDNKIRMAIEPEVSAKNDANGVQVGTTVVPGFSTTRIKSVVELRPDETLMIGGLLQQTTSTSESGVPVLRRLPLIGKIFESTSNETQDTEFLILITPHLLLPEKSPINDETKVKGGKDLIVEATKFLPTHAEDSHSDAITQYILQNKRYILDKVEKAEKTNAVENAGIKEMAGKPATFQATKPAALDDLSDLKARLQQL